MIKSEILAPAGSFEALTAAVRSGADAVYFGTGNFNARRNASNFSGDDLQRAVIAVGLAAAAIVGTGFAHGIFAPLKIALSSVYQKSRRNARHRSI